MIQIVKTSSLPLLTDGCSANLSDRIQRKEFYAKAVKERGHQAFSVDLGELVDQFGLTAVSDAVEGLLLGGYHTERFPAVPRPEPEIELTGLPAEAEAIVRETEVLVRGICWARDMTNRPGNLLRPADFAREVQRLFEGLPAEVEILEEDKLQQLGLNAILSIGQSSAYRPCLCIIRYRGDPENGPVTGLVGKGVTCDTGGYCLKASSSMAGIRGDMGGGAAVAGAIYALAKNGVRANVTGLIPMVENRISDGALLPGDVITSYSGKTIEIVNTDAEGRLILADAVSFAVLAEHVDRVLDIATLTGGVCASLGFGVAGMLCDQEEFYHEFEQAAARAGERYLRFPIYPEYEKMIDSEVADVKNMGGQFAGTITAGLFIRRFANQVPWLHVDIAGTAWTDPPVFEYQAKGATGAGVTTLYYLR